MKKNSLLKNTVFLYLLTFSNQLINLVTIPYQTRVLGPQIFGKITVATSLMVYVQLIMDFGFLLSATEKVSKNADDSTYISKLFSAVTLMKVVLGITVGTVLYLFCEIVEAFRLDKTLYMLYFAAYVVSALLPDFIYRGKEEMRAITIRTVLIRALFAAMMLLFVKSSSDYMRLPVLLLIGNCVAVIFSFWHIYKSFSVRFHKIEFPFFGLIVKDSVPFFVSRISSTFYQTLNTLILGVKYAGLSVIGYYGSADKLLGIAKSFSSPVADSLYPYMIRKKDYNLIKKILLMTTPIILLGAIVVYLQAEWICVFLFGAEYYQVADILRCLLPAMIVIFPTYILCFPTLNPIGLSNYANFSNVIGLVVMLLILTLLFVTDSITVYSLCIASSISEVSVFLFRFCVAWKYRKRMKQ